MILRWFSLIQSVGLVFYNTYPLSPSHPVINNLIMLNFPSPCIQLLILFSIITLGDTCGQTFTLSHKFIEKEPAPVPGRLLLTEAPHPFKIHGHYPSNLTSNSTIDLIKTIFGVAKTYFSKVIKVIRLQQKDTKYPESHDTCGVHVPEEYLNYGFNQSIIDLVVFVMIENSQQLDYVSAAAPCVKVRRPIYGYIIFNSAHVSVQKNSVGVFHKNILVTIHEITHILGMRPQFFNGFYENPTGMERKSVDTVMKNVSGRSYIITPKVMEFVKEHFGCEGVGALLEEEGGEGSTLSHWERKVFMDELMTASDLPQGLRMSKLTLALLADTNFYAFVDIEAADEVHWGRDRGCQFAMGLSNNLPQYVRTMDMKLCDFYDRFVAHSTNKDMFGSKAIYAHAYPLSVCSFPEYQKKDELPSKQKIYQKISTKSRCFEVEIIKNNKVQLFPTCYETQCTPHGVNITIHKDTGTCVKQASYVIISGFRVRCPEDFQRFCAQKTCPNWCSQKGICINGTCICNPPFIGPSCQQQCPKFTEHGTGKCVDSCTPNQLILQNNICMQSCPPGFVSVNGNCKQDVVVKVKFQTRMACMGLVMILFIII